MRIPVAVLAGSALLAALSCRDVSSPRVIDLGGRVAGWVPDSAAVLAHEDYSGFGDSTRTVVTDAGSFSAIWAQLWSGFEPKPPQPPVDFSNDVVLVVALGGRPSGGYGITIDSVVGFSAGTVVYLTTAAPGRTCGVTDLFTQPAELVRLLQPRAPILFLEHGVVASCS